MTELLQSGESDHKPLTGQGFCHIEGPLGGASVALRFDGTLAGAPVVWDATIWTRAGYLRDHPGERLAGNLIDVGEIGAQGRRLTVVLDVPAVDRPTVQKTLHMIRQWKRLAPGRHRYGGAA